MIHKKQSLHNRLSFWLVQNLSQRWRFWVPPRFALSYQNDGFQGGQALVTLLVFTIVAITITSAAVVIILTNSVGTSKFEQGTNTYYSAESGAENALLRLLRDPNYTGETLPVGNASVIISVANTGSTYTITSGATLGNFIRRVEVTATFVNNILTVDSWKEVF